MERNRGAIFAYCRRVSKNEWKRKRSDNWKILLKTSERRLPWLERVSRALEAGLRRQCQEAARGERLMPEEFCAHNGGAGNSPRGWGGVQEFREALAYPQMN